MPRFLTYRLPPPPAGSYTTIHECPDCGLFSGLTMPKPGDDQCCLRCLKVLRRARSRPLDKALAFYMAAAMFYPVAMLTPLLHVVLYGRVRTSQLPSGPLMLDDQNFWQVACLVLLTTVLLPLIKIVGYLTVLIGMRLHRQPRWLGYLFGWLKHLGPWTMIEVFMLGFLVAYTRLQAMTHVILGPAVYAMIGLMLSMVAADAALDPESVWERVRRPRSKALAETRATILLGCDNCHQVSHGRHGENCPRCGEKLYKRKTASIMRTSALTVAAVLLYVPSNLFPIMSVTKLGKTQAYTIAGGMMELAHVGLFPLAVLVFVASIAIPIFKLLALGFLLCETGRGSRWQLLNRTRLYRLIDFIGRWSMVDVYMVSILVALVHFGLLADVVAGPGAIYFASVVVLTILAVECFDPRLMWDIAGESAAEPLVVPQQNPSSVGDSFNDIALPADVTQGPK